MPDTCTCPSFVYFGKLHSFLSPKLCPSLCFIANFSGRVKHGRHFTFKSVTGDVAITLVSSGIEVHEDFIGHNYMYMYYYIYKSC